jgi:hypothetical protein
MNRHLLSLVLVSAISLAWVGCGDDSGGSGSGGQGGAGAAGGGTGTGTAGGSTGGGGAGGSSSGPPEAPIMKSVAPMEGALHVVWENVTPDCDTIELDRNHDGGAFETAYTLTGAATSQHDTAAIPPGEYCYKARCTKGDLVSPDSNEKCGTP